MKTKYRFFACLTVFLGFLLSFSDLNEALAKDPDSMKAANFYRGKVITSIVPTKPGGSYDIYARLLSPFLEKYSGAKVVVKNISGGGGTLGINAMYRAKPDGLTIGNLMIAGTAPAQLTGAQGVNYDLLKFTYLCRLTDDPQVFVVDPKSSFKTLTDVIEAKDKVKMAATGTSGATYIGSLALKLGFDIASLDIVTGYQGGQDCNLAVMRGDVSGMVGSVSGRLRNIKDGDLRPLVVFATDRVPDLPDVPTVFEFDVKGERLNSLKAFTVMSDFARVLVASPDIPAERAEFLHLITQKSMQDPELAEFAKKQRLEINYKSGKEVEKVIKEMFAHPPEELLNELKKIM